ncbi:titin-like isoform X2 [Phlebotomus argentipes]|uniref:titin-like isoform X2 n=1 Tax=Phlebotomus argentipes TaxID=94469 RepID=UPI0028935500|nr:titin-like isoform X2 [Phlebotomus argentipes]
MGNTSGKHQLRDRPRKNVHWKTAVAPGKPTLVPGDADSAPDVVTIRWERPLSDGGAPILGYLVEHRRTGSPHWVRATPGLVPYTELTLSGLEPGWRYQFRVTAENIVGLSPASELSDGLTVTLQRTAISVPRFVQELQDSTAIENERVEFHVNVVGTPPPEINWFKDGFEMFSSRRTKILTENDTSLLVIHQTALTDEGEIKCTATNRAGHVVTRCRLKVEAPPKIRLPRQYEDGLLIEADEIIRLKVGTAGRPPPTIAWLQNGEEVKSDNRHEIVTTERNSSLKITNARRSDRGEYNVRAINSLGEDNASFLVTVTSRPSPPGKVTISMSIGKSVSLTWSEPEDDGGCKIGNYVVEYYRVGWNVWLKATTTRQLSTTLNDLIEGSEYKFRVKAENPYGMSEPSQESDMLFIPDPKRGITKPNSSSDTSVFIDDQRPTIVPRRKHTASPPAPASQSLDSNINQLTRMVDKSEQTHVARLRIQRPTVNIQLIPQVFDSETIARDISYGTPDPITLAAAEKRDKSPAKQKERSPAKPERSPEKQVNLQLPEPVKPPERTPSPAQEVREQITREKTPEPVQQTVLSEKSTVRVQLAPADVGPRIVQMKIQEPSPEKKIEEVSKEDIVPEIANLTPEKDMQKPWKSLRAPRENNEGVHSSGEFVLVLYDDKDPSKNTPSKQQSFDFEVDEVMPPPPLSLSAPELSIEIPPPPILRRSVSSTELLYERAMARFYHAVEAEEEAEKVKKQGQIVPTLRKTPSLTRKDSFGEHDRGERRSSLRRRLSGEMPAIVPGNLRRKDSETGSVEKEIPVKKTKRKSPMKSNESIEYVKDRGDLEYTDDYTDSTVSSDESETEKFKRKVREHANVFSGDEELETYHPSGAQVRVGSPYSQPAPDQSAEILSRPFNLPSPDFVPKPILKRRTSLEGDSSSKEDDNDRKSKTPEKGALSKIFDLKPLSKGSSNSKLQEEKPVVVEKPLTASELAKKKKLEERQASLEEEKVVIDHYSDLVREFSSGRRTPVPIYLSADELKLAAEPEEEEPPPKPVEVKRAPSAEPKNRSRSSSATRKRPETAPSEKAQSSNVTTRGRSPAPKTVAEKKMPKSRDVSASSQTRRPVKSAVEKRAASKTRNRSESKSPAAANRRPLAVKAPEVPKAKEPPSPPPSPSRSQTPEEISQEDADIKVKSTLAWVTDLALFLAACWVYFFKDARLVIPILALMVYRQIGDAVKNNMPSWMKKKGS